MRRPYSRMAKRGSGTQACHESIRGGKARSAGITAPSPSVESSVRYDAFQRSRSILVPFPNHLGSLF